METEAWVGRRFALLVVFLLVVTACLRGSSPEAERPNEIVLAIGGGDVQRRQATIDLWNTLHPETPARIEQLPRDADGQRIQMGLELNAKSDNFDVLGLDVIWTGEFAEYGWVSPLDEFRPEAEQKLLGGPLRSAIYQDRLWALPYSSNTGFLYYRKDLVDQPPKTWNEAVELGTAGARKAGIAPYVGQGAAYEGLVVNYLELLWGAGGQIFSDTGNEVTFNSTDAARAAAEFMRRSQENGFYAPGFNTMQEDQAKTTFASGQAVFMRNWPSFYAFLQRPENSQIIGKFDIAPLPVFKEGENPSALGGFNLAVSTFSDKQDLAKEFVRFAAFNQEAQVALGQNQIPPVLASAYEELNDDPVMTLLRQLLPGAHPRPPVPFYNDMSLAFQQQIFAAYNGQKPIPAALDAVESQVTRIVERRQRIQGAGQG